MLISMNINTWLETEKSVAEKILLFNASASKPTTTVIRTMRTRSLLRRWRSSAGIEGFCISSGRVMD